MILGDLPWDSATDSDEAFVRYFRRENISLAELMALIPSDSRHLISIMLNLNPHQRPNMTEVFANSWIQNIRV
jgi:serine/threonine protein kinase